MGLGDFFKGKSETPPIDELTDDQIKKALKGKKAPILSAKDLKKMKQDDIRRTVGESGFKALTGMAKDKRAADLRRVERGVSNAQTPADLARIKASDPRAYQRLLDQEARRQGLI
jgi:hypothetical protein